MEFNLSEKIINYKDSGSSKLWVSDVKEFIKLLKDDIDKLAGEKLCH